MNRQLILDFATKAHFGQKRKDGQDYISHPITVAEIAIKSLPEFNRVNESCLSEDMVYAASLFHDILEDTSVSESDIINILLSSGCRQIPADYILDAVIRLTRKSKADPVIDYLNHISHSRLAHIVKLADLEHNMSDLSPSNLLDKYQLCRHYLILRSSL